MKDRKYDRLTVFEQYLPGLEVDEIAEEAKARSISAEEARLRSETARRAFEHTEGAKPPVYAGRNGCAPTRDDGLPEWMEEYLRLRNAGWPWRVACYIAWAGSPKKLRWPKTQDLLATEVLGLTSDRVITTWRKKNPAIDTVVAVLQAAPLMDHRRDIYDALIRSATEGDYKGHADRKLALELLGDYTPRSKLDVRGRSVVGEVDLSQISDEELDELAQRLLGPEEDSPVENNGALRGGTLREDETPTPTLPLKGEGEEGKSN